MKNVVYDSVQKFLDENENLLAEREEVNQLVIYNAKNSLRKEISRELFFGRIENDDSEVEFIYGRCAPYNLLVQQMKAETDYRGIKTLVDYIIDKKLIIKGINANKAVSDLFIKLYKEKVSAEFEKMLSMDIMRIDKLNDIKLPSGTFRRASMNDLDIMADFYINFSGEAVNEELGKEEAYEKIKGYIEKGIMYIFEDDKKKIVSMAVPARQLSKGICISAVYTRIDERGKGYCKALMHNLCKFYLERGYEYCSLYVDKTNPISNRAYKDVGFKIIEDNYDYRIS